ncbi:MAG TPA: N-acetyl-gamma-glutamyl-phosphate reductase [Bryobacteraceae bacterium]|nr:N-acetyl-gamma-glutamyl-phosphate reductase [Bryobacteraceae bacterium]
MGARVGVIGYLGYGGAELVGILGRHPAVEHMVLEDRADVADPPRPRGYKGHQRIQGMAEAVQRERLALVLLATHHDVSIQLVPKLLQTGAKVVDLSAAFRLRTPERYARWYGDTHTQPELLASAVYGLPEFNREAVRAATLLANPGCYPTAVNLALRPLVEAGVIDRSAGIVCDAKSGVSGAGRKPTLKTSFCEVTGNFSAYSILGHRHVPEVLLTSGLEEAEFSFTAHLLPVERGILETIYFRVNPGHDSASLMSIYEKRYQGEPFVRLYDPGHMPELHAIARTNFCDIGVKVDAATRRAVVVAAIDNLVKGAAGQAVQNMNLMLGRPETEGLL